MKITYLLMLMVLSAVIIIAWKIGSFVHNECQYYIPNQTNPSIGNEAAALQMGVTNYTINKNMDWHIGSTYFNYGCSFHIDYPSPSWVTI